MKQRDFFAYCTSLPLIQLKAVGAFSQVRHFREGDQIYSAGEEAEELFIVNRGAAELILEKTPPGAPAKVVSRGEIFGTIGPLLNRPRDHSAKARAGLSVQCFRRSDFPELLARVPSFFLFLSEKLAARLFQTTELVRSQHSVLELTGSLANFDVITIYQTILHSQQTGLLTITDAAGEKVSEFFFERGTPRSGRFAQLAGEEAFWQLFLHDDPGATFSFANGPDPRPPGETGGELSRQADEILINAIQMRDEFEDVRKRLRHGAATVRRKQLNLVWDKPALAEFRPVAEAVWQTAYSNPIALRDLAPQTPFCDLKVYKAVDELVRTGLFALETPQPERQLASV
ncbi:MAG: cyclic nucleotide-binding domain-containing protein [Chthoniobacterales bacterium]